MNQRFILLTVAVVLLTIASAIAATEITGCGMLYEGEYYLSSDFYFDSSMTTTVELYPAQGPSYFAEVCLIFDSECSWAGCSVNGNGFSFLSPSSAAGSTNYLALYADVLGPSEDPTYDIHNFAYADVNHTLYLGGTSVRIHNISVEGGVHLKSEAHEGAGSSFITLQGKGGTVANSSFVFTNDVQSTSFFSMYQAEGSLVFENVTMLSDYSAGVIFLTSSLYAVDIVVTDVYVNVSEGVMLFSDHGPGGPGGSSIAFSDSYFWRDSGSDAFISVGYFDTVIMRDVRVDSMYSPCLELYGVVHIGMNDSSVCYSGFNSVSEAPSAGDVISFEVGSPFNQYYFSLLHFDTDVLQSAQFLRNKGWFYDINDTTMYLSGSSVQNYYYAGPGSNEEYGCYVNNEDPACVVSGSEEGIVLADESYTYTTDYVIVEFANINGTLYFADLVSGEDWVYLHPSSDANVPATITFNVTSANLYPTRNGELCYDACSNIISNSTHLSFDVSGWSNYSYVNAPSAENLTLLPATIYTRSNLSITYDYVGENPENGTIINWYVNDSLVHTGETLNSTFFVKDDNIIVELIPCDDIQCGDTINTSKIVQKTPLQLVNVPYSITPLFPVYTRGGFVYQLEVYDPDVIDGTATITHGSLMGGWYSLPDRGITCQMSGYATSIHSWETISNTTYVSNSSTDISLVTINITGWHVNKFPEFGACPGSYVIRLNLINIEYRYVGITNSIPVASNVSIEYISGSVVEVQYDWYDLDADLVRNKNQTDHSTFKWFADGQIISGAESTMLDTNIINTYELTVEVTPKDDHLLAGEPVNYTMQLQKPFIQSLQCPTITYPNEDNLPFAKVLPINITVFSNNYTGFTLTSEPSATLCTHTEHNSTTRTYHCNYTLNYWMTDFDILINVSNSYGYTELEDDCVVGGLLAMKRVTDAVGFSGAAPGLSDVRSDDAIVLRNTGNTALNIHLTAYDLVGVQYPSDTLSASSFKAGHLLSSSVLLDDGVQKDLAFNIPVGEQANDYFWLWLSMSSSQRIQDYKTTSPWQVVGLS